MATGHDLVLEGAGRHRGAGAALALEGERVLVFARDAVALGDVLGGHAHVVVVDGAHEAVAEQVVLEQAVAHAVAGAGLGQQIGGQRHVLHAGRHHDLGVAAGDGLGGQVERLHARAAQLVDGHRRHLVGQTGGVQSEAARVLALAGLQHVADDDFVDLGRAPLPLF